MGGYAHIYMSRNYVMRFVCSGVSRISTLNASPSLPTTYPPTIYLPYNTHTYTHTYILNTYTSPIHPYPYMHVQKVPKKADKRYNQATKTFWFEREVELNLVFRDYIELGSRLGWTPTRKQMEVNFIGAYVCFMLL